MTSEVNYGIIKMKMRIVILLSGVLLVNSSAYLAGSGTPPSAGYACANFSLGAVLSAGQFPAEILYNPPQLSKHFQTIGQGHLFFKVAEELVRDDECASIEVNNCWPLTNCQYQDNRLPGLIIKLQAICPVVAGNVLDTSLPALLAWLEIKNQTKISRRIKIYQVYNFNEEIYCPRNRK